MKNFAIVAVLALALPMVAIAEKKTAAPAPPSFRPAAAPAAAGSGATVTPTTHQNQFSCTASIDSTTANPGTTNMYKLSGSSCPATISLSAFTKTQTGLTATCTSTGQTYSADTAVSPGQTNAYVYTATIGGLESGPSNCLTLTTPVFSTGTVVGTAY